MKNEDPYLYRLMGLAPETPEGFIFRSSVPDLENRPELWKVKCPYHISDKAMSHVTVEKKTP